MSVYVITEDHVLGEVRVTKVVSTHSKAVAYIKKNRKPFTVYEILKFEVTDD